MLRSVVGAGHHRHRDDEPDAVHGLNRLNNRREAPDRQQIRDLADQPLYPRLGVRNGVDVILKTICCAGCVTCPTEVVRVQSYCMTGLGAMAGVAGEAAPDGGAGHCTSSGAGGR